MKTRAAICEGPGQPLIFETLDIDDPKDNEVAIKLVATSICGTDMGFKMGSPYKYPIVLGHEGTGIVEKIGPSVKNFKVGDRVAVNSAYCGECKFCLSGRYHFCENAMNQEAKAFDGTYRVHRNGDPVSTLFSLGTFMEHIVVAEGAVTPIPDGIDLALAAPIGCGIVTGSGAVLNTMKPQINSSIVIFGAGTVGLSATMAAKLKNAKYIIVVDVYNQRLELAKEFGATHTLNPKEVNVEEECRRIIGGGADFTCETSGNSAALKTAIQVLDRGGKVIVVGASGDITINITNDLMSYGKSLILQYSAGTLVKNAVALVCDLYNRGMFPIDKLMTYYKFEDINQAFEDAASGKIIKAILTY